MKPVKHRVLAGAFAIATLSGSSALTTAGVADAAELHASSYHYKNCKALHKHFKHGVGKKHAKDHTSGTPVTNFKHSTRIYKKVIAYRSGLDRDKDGIACEAH